MREITRDELEQLKTGRSFPSTAIYDAVGEMEIGSTLLVETSDWQARTDLGQAIQTEVSRKRKGLIGKKFSTKKLRDGSGWIVSRKV